MNTGIFKLIIVALAVALMLLQFRLWFGENNLRDTAELERQLEQQVFRLEKQKALNDDLRIEVNSLKQGLDQIESKARSELGMIKPDETFFMFLDSGEATQKEQQNP